MNDNIPKSENVLLDLTFDFSLEIIKFCDMLEAERKYIIARQLLRSEQVSVQISEKLNNPKARQILFINSK